MRLITHSPLTRTRLPSSSSDDPDNSRFTRALSSADDATVTVIEDATVTVEVMLMRALPVASSSIGTGVAPLIDTDRLGEGGRVCKDIHRK